MELTKKEVHNRIMAIIVYYLFAIVIRYATNKTDLLNHVNIAFFKTVIQGSGPAIGALIACYAFSFKSPMNFKGNAHTILVPLALFWIIPILALEGVLFIKAGHLSMAIISILMYALLEEVGWRGFLQPALSFLPKFIVVSIITVLWFIWHLNFELSLSNLIFFFVLLAGSWGIGAVASKTHSLIAVSAFHAAYDIYTAIDTKSYLVNAILILCVLLWLCYVIGLNQFKNFGILKSKLTL